MSEEKVKKTETQASTGCKLSDKELNKVTGGSAPYDPTGKKCTSEYVSRSAFLAFYSKTFGYPSKSNGCSLYGWPHLPEYPITPIQNCNNCRFLGDRDDE